jgi:ketosteroid isomerase-like protein
MGHHGAESIARASYAAYAARDREAFESLLAADFRFTSPLDNRIDRRTYFERCWPNHLSIERFDLVHVVRIPGDGEFERVLVTYEAKSADKTRFRNTEIQTIRDGRIHAVEVYFGWSIPHAAREGGFIDSPRKEALSP